MKVTVIQDDVVTAVEVQVELHSPPLFGYSPLFVATGSARRHPDDAPDDLVGRALAFSRAFRDLHRQLRDYGYSLAGQ